MNTAPLTRLFPTPSELRPLHGLYLDDEFPKSQAPFLYGNYVTSLDGRIAFKGSDEGDGVPEDITNPRDWRLFRELAARSDVMLVSGSYLRRRGAGSAQEILALRHEDDPDSLEAWREQRGYPPLPDIAIVSRELDFPVPLELSSGKRRVFVITGRDGAGSDSARLREQDVEIVCTGGEGVRGDELVSILQRRGYHRVYNAAGPGVHRLLLGAGKPDRLYLTFAPRLLAGDEFYTVVSGSRLEPASRFRLRHLYLDADALDGDGQLFACYERT